jgi:hypothetical protein
VTGTFPITPPPELVEQWEEQFLKRPTINGCFIQSYIATKAAQWGADAELEACCEWVSKYVPYLADFPMPEDKLRVARRPKPPSLKEQALAALTQYMTGETILTKDSVESIRRALETLND